MSDRRFRRAMLGWLIPFTLLAAVGGCPTQQVDDTGDDTNSGDSSDPFVDAVTVDLAADGTAKVAESISRSGGFDVFKIPGLNVGDRVIISIETTSGDLDAVAALFDDLENMVAFNDDRASDSSDLDPLIDVTIRGKAGDYFVGVAPFSVGDTAGDYSIDVEVLRQAGDSDPQTQIVFLNFEGGTGILVENVIDQPLDLEAFSAADVGLAAGETQALKNRIVELVEDRYAGYDLVVQSSDEFFEPTVPHSTIFFGGFNRSAFAISQQIDTFNQDLNDDAIIFTRSFSNAFSETPTAEEMATAIANTVAHEIGHLLGLVHTKACDDLMDTTCGNDSILRAQEFSRAPLDDSVFPIGFQDSTEILTWVLGLAGL